MKAKEPMVYVSMGLLQALSEAYPNCKSGLALEDHIDDDGKVEEQRIVIRLEFAVGEYNESRAAEVKKISKKTLETLNENLSEEYRFFDVSVVISYVER